MRARAVVVILLGLVLVAAGVAYYVSSTTTGTLAIQLRDTPADWSHLVVTFSEVRVHPAGAANDSGWIPLTLQLTRIDFLALGNLTRLLALDRLPPGTYTQVRILISTVSGVLSSGVPVAMSVPDGVLKTTTPFALHGGGTTTVTLDLDLSRSITQTSAGWVFTPVLGPLEVS